MRRFHRFFHTPGRIARDRMRLLLLSDRVQCSPDMMEHLKQEMIQTVSRYMEIGDVQPDIRIRHGENGRKEPDMWLCANIPVKSVDREMARSPVPDATKEVLLYEKKIL